MKCPKRIKIISTLIIFFHLVTGISYAILLINPEGLALARALSGASNNSELKNLLFNIQLYFFLIGVFIVPIFCIQMWRGNVRGLFGFTIWTFTSLLLATLLVGFGIQLLVNYVLAVVLLAILYVGESGKYLFCKI